MKKPRGYWNYENCYNEARKYKSLKEFSDHCDPAYRVALKKGWLDDYDWFISKIKWNYQTCMEESKKYSTHSEFATKCSGAYHVACKNKWIDEYTWLPSDGRQLRYKTSKWNYESCYEEARKFKTRGEFARLSGSAYNKARKHKWLDDYIWLKDERLDLAEGKIDLVYSYEFIEENAVYIGRTLIKRSKERDKQHLFKMDSVSTFAKEMDIPVPEMKVLESGLTLKEGVQKEAWWIEKYREDGWRILNKAKAGSYEEAKKYETLEEFKTTSGSAYAVACKNGWIDDYDWLERKRIRRGTWSSYEKCYQEALKYTRRCDFEKSSNSAFASSVRNGWIEKFTWLKLTRKPRNYWDHDRCFEEAKNYSSIFAFQKGNSSAYHAAVKGGWLKEYTWFKLSRKPRGYWNYEQHRSKEV